MSLLDEGEIDGHVEISEKTFNLSKKLIEILPSIQLKSLLQIIIQRINNEKSERFFDNINSNLVPREYGHDDSNHMNNSLDFPITILPNDLAEVSSYYGMVESLDDMININVKERKQQSGMNYKDIKSGISAHNCVVEVHMVNSNDKLSKISNESEECKASINEKLFSINDPFYVMMHFNKNSSKHSTCLKNLEIQNCISPVLSSITYKQCLNTSYSENRLSDDLKSTNEYSNSDIKFTSDDIRNNDIIQTPLICQKGDVGILMSKEDECEACTLITNKFNEKSITLIDAPTIFDEPLSIWDVIEEKISSSNIYKDNVKKNYNKCITSNIVKKVTNTKKKVKKYKSFKVTTAKKDKFCSKKSYSKVSNRSFSFKTFTKNQHIGFTSSKVVNGIFHQGWQCSYKPCGYFNRDNRPTCKYCLNSRISCPLMSKTDILCANCGYINYKSRLYCKKCKFLFITLK